MSHNEHNCLCLGVPCNGGAEHITCSLLPPPFSAQRGHDDDVSSTSEDDGYPEDMDQDKHDDSTDDSDTDRSDGESEGDEFVHRDENERNNSEEKKSGVRR